MPALAPTLFEWNPPAPERVAAIEQVAQHAEENHPGWREQAVGFVRQYAAMHREFISEHCTDWAYANGLAKPHDPRAFGQVYRNAARQGLIRKNGFGVSEKRASPTVKWISLDSKFRKAAE